MSAIYLGIDIGTTSAKCLAVGEDGVVLAIAQQGYAMSHPRQGWAEQDPEDYWRALVSTVRECVDQCRSEGDIVAMAMSTQGNTLIVTDRDGAAVAPAMSWMDRRAEREYSELVAETGKDYWYRETGSRLTPLSPACKIRWVSRSAPELAEQVRRYCFVPDYLTTRLCGRFVVDVPSASWTPLFSSLDRAWSEVTMGLLGVPRESLPEAVESGTVIGVLLPEVADELGLSRECKLVAGAFDQAAACGAGAEAGKNCVLSCGTAWVLYAVSGAPSANGSVHIPICCHVSASEWGMVQPFTGGSAYDWLHKTFGGNPDQGESRAEPPVFIPHLYGGLSPDWRESSKGSLLGLTMAHTWHDIELAMMHGLAFEARRNVEATERLSGPIPSVRMVGGAGKSKIWPQIIANVLRKPVEISDCVESACMGAAKLAAGEVAKAWSDDDVREVLPVAEQVDVEDRQFRRYVKFYEALADLYE